MRLFAMEWVQNKKENSCFSLWDQGLSKVEHWCYLFDLSKQGHNLLWSQKAPTVFSDTLEKPMANETYDFSALSASGFPIPQSRSPRAAKAAG